MIMAIRKYYERCSPAQGGNNLSTFQQNVNTSPIDQVSQNFALHYSLLCYVFILGYIHDINAPKGLYQTTVCDIAPQMR